MDYNNLIKDLREKLILSQEDFAKLIGVSFSTVNRWETAKHNPTIKYKRILIDLCKQNNIDVEKYRGN